jgi:GntR family transcriptional regulator
MNELHPSATLSIPLYKEVQGRMLRALSDKEWSPGMAIPAERLLCQRFGVSVGTLRKAIDGLVAENILIRHQGRGTFVATHTRDQHLFRFFNVVRHDGLKRYPSPELVSFSRGKGEKAAREQLCMSGKAMAFQFTNVHSLNGEPLLVDEITVPEALFAGLTAATLRHRPSTLYELYQVEFGLNVIRIEERIRSSQASTGHARLLGVAAAMPLLEIHRIAFSYNNRPVERRISYVNTQNYEYLTKVTS